MTIATSHDGQWATVRVGREVTLFAAGSPPPVGQLTLESDDVDLALVGPPTVLAVVTRQPTAKVELCQPPYLDVAARLDLDQPMRLAAVTGQRLMLLGEDHKTVQVVRAAGRSLTAQTLDVGGQVEFAVGLERNQVLFSLLRKLEVWDAVSARPLLRLQLQLPPPPRTVGAALGHLFVTRPGSDEVYVYRLSDGRPFRHFVGSPVEEAISHPASPIVVLVTARGLVRLHCFAHSLTLIDAPWMPGTPLAQLPIGEDISLVGVAEGSSEPWRVPIAGVGAPAVGTDAPPAETNEVVVTTAADKLKQMREQSSPTGSPSPVVVVAPPRARAWRDPLAAFGLELARGVESEIPVTAVDTELGELAHRLGLPTPARRALIALYSLYLVGEPRLAISRLAHVLGDWTEALGQGDLGALAMITKHDGRVALRSTLTELLDGCAPRSRIVGGAPGTPRAGITTIARADRSDAAIETELATQLGRIAVVGVATGSAVLEARLLGGTALAFTAPSARPSPWPRDAGLVIVTDGDGPAWLRSS